MYCSQCGYEVDLNSNFCAKCGHKIDSLPEVSQLSNQDVVAPEAEPPVEASISALESVLWVFGVQHKLSLLKVIPCNIVFMKDKVVLAYLTPELQKSESAKVSQDIKSNGIGFLKGSAAMMKHWANFHNRYYTMTTDQILAEEPSNIILQYQNIQKVLFQCDSNSTNSDGDSYGSKGKLQFELSGGETIKFTHSQDHDKSIKEMLANLFGERLNYKK